MFQELVNDSDVDADCEVILGSVLPALAKLTKKLFHDHLPGGRYQAAPEDVRNATTGTAKHNKFCETLFAFYDQMLRTKPHISTIAAEASLMFTFNKTQQWLDAKTQEEEVKILTESRKQAKRIQREFQYRRNKIQEQKAQQMREKFEKAEAAKKKQLEAKIKQSNDIIYWGLLQSEEEVEEALERLSHSEKVALLKAQLKFRKNVLEQKPSEADLFNITVMEDSGTTRKRRNLSADELAQNVKQLIRESLSMEPAEREESGTSLVRKKVKHRFNTEEGEKWWSGSVVSQVSNHGVN